MCLHLSIYLLRKQMEISLMGLELIWGWKDFAVVSNGTVYRNINKTARIRKLEKQLRRALAKAFP